MKGKTILSRVKVKGVGLIDINDNLTLPEVFVDRKGQVENLAQKIHLSDEVGKDG